MSTTGIIGTLSICLDDGAGNQHVLSLVSATLSISTKMRGALDPKYITGKQSWRAQGACLQLIDDATLDRESYLTLIEDAALNKTPLSTVFASPTGAEYLSTGYIDRFEVGGEENAVLSGSFSIQGTESLELKEGPKIFMVGQDDSFYTLAGDFTQEIDTQLDLSSYSIIDIAFNQVNEKIYGLVSSGKVYAWDIDGSNFAEQFDTGHPQFTKIFIDNANQYIILSRQNTTGFEYSSFAYTLAGSYVWDLSHRYNFITLAPASFASGGRGYIYIYSAGTASTDVKNSFRIRMSDGLVEFLQAVTLFGVIHDVAFDEVGGRAFRGINEHIYEYSTEIPDNPNDAVQIGERFFSADSIDYFEYCGDGYVVGCGGDRLGSFKIGDTEGVPNRTVNDMRLVCTKKGYL